jgi:hypothetical protein
MPIEPREVWRSLPEVLRRSIGPLMTLLVPGYFRRCSPISRSRSTHGPSTLPCIRPMLLRNAGTCSYGDAHAVAITALRRGLTLRNGG